MMIPERLSEVRELLFKLERKMRPLEWDLNRNQINEFKKQELSRLKENYVQLQNEFTSLQAEITLLKEKELLEKELQSQ